MRLRYNRPMEILVKLVSIFDLAKNSPQVTTAYFSMAF